MKVAISSTGKDMKSNVAEVFGRCPYFIIADIKDDKIAKVEAIENMSADQAGGAGISAAKTVAENEVKAVIARNVGPRAIDVLKQFSIEIYEGKGRVDEALEQFLGKKLKRLHSEVE